MASTNERGYIPSINDDEKLLQRRVADTVKQVSATGCARFSGFFNDREKQLAVAGLNRAGWKTYTFYGGYEGAEREMLCVFEDYESAQVSCFPIICLRVTTQYHANSLTHRDYLGAMLGCGVVRECIGDIRTDGQGATVWIQEKVAVFLLEELRQVGRADVKVHILTYQPEEMPEQAEAASQRASVASLRLDAVLAAMLHESRTRIVAMVQQGKVQINHIEITSPHHTVFEGDVFSVRGTGKFRLANIGGKSRKDRIWIEFMKY